MSAARPAPLIFLDVDGPLIPLRARPAGWPAPSDSTGNPLLGRLDPRDGARLAGLGGILIWATTWMDEANEVIAPRLGLPQLPVASWPEDSEVEGFGPDRGLHWKTAGLCRWAAGRPFVWVDDEITDVDRRWVAGHHAGPALLHRVDPHTGLTEADFATVRRWVDSVC